MLSKIKHLIQKTFNLFGLQLNKLNVINNSAYQTVQALKANNINVVFDIGANVGQFSCELRAYGYKGKIISFEPLPQAYETLYKQALKDNDWIVHQRCAVGAEAGQVEMNVSGNSVSSSVLPMLDTHENAAPQSKYTHQEIVPLITLDEVFSLYCNQNDNVFLKVDTQGYEWAVLQGAKMALTKSRGVLLELSLVPLYEGQKLWRDLVDYLMLTKHSLYAIQPGFTNQTTGETLQVDGLFFKKNND